MLGGIDRITKEVKEKYGITYDPNKFTFCIAKWDKLQKDGGELKELVFTYDVTGQVLRIPYNKRLNFQKYLNSGVVNDIPSGQKLI